MSELLCLVNTLGNATRIIKTTIKQLRLYNPIAVHMYVFTLLGFDVIKEYSLLRVLSKNIMIHTYKIGWVILSVTIQANPLIMIQNLRARPKINRLIIDKDRLKGNKHYM